MNATYQFEIKQRGGKWAPQCQTTLADKDATWERFVAMKRKVRCVKFENGAREVVAKHEPAKER